MSTDVIYNVFVSSMLSWWTQVLYNVFVLSMLSVSTLVMYNVFVLSMLSVSTLVIHICVIDVVSVDTGNTHLCHRCCQCRHW